MKQSEQEEKMQAYEQDHLDMLRGYLADCAVLLSPLENARIRTSPPSSRRGAAQSVQVCSLIWAVWVIAPARIR